MGGVSMKHGDRRRSLTVMLGPGPSTMTGQMIGVVSLIPRPHIDVARTNEYRADVVY